MHPDDKRMTTRRILSLVIALVALIAPVSCGTAASSPQSASGARTAIPSSSPTNQPNVPAARLGAGLAYDSKHGYLLMFGGANTDQSASPPPGFIRRSDSTNLVSNETWTWDGNRWTLLHPPSSPSARSFPAMAFDPSSHQVILVDGGAPNSDPGRSDMWTWDGATWTELHPAHLPPANSDKRVAIVDRDIGAVLIIATDYTSGPPHFVIWRWTGSDWNQTDPVGAPSRRFGYGFAYDPDQHQEVLAAGYLSPEQSVGETWLLKHGQWSQAPGSVGPTGYAAAAYDEARHELVLMLAAGTPPRWADETWIWDGAAWTRQDPAHRPPGGLSSQSLAYDVTSGRVLMFGGKSDELGSNMINQTWAWDGTDWARLT